MRYIYVITNLINGKVYIGQTKDWLSRKKGHWYCGTHTKEGHLYDSMRKYGVDQFTFEVIEECEVEVVDDRERHWISHYDSMNPEKGYNKESGGHALKKLSDEIKRKISIKLKGMPFTPERCKNISLAQRGIPKPKCRKEWNPEKGRKITEKLKGRPLSQEHKRSVSEGLKRYMASRGEWHPTQEAVQRMKDAQAIVGAKRTEKVTLDATHPDVQPKECPVCGRLYSPKSLKRYDVKRHLKKRWCTRSCGRIGQNKKANLRNVLDVLHNFSMSGFQRSCDQLCFAVPFGGQIVHSMRLKLFSNFFASCAER
jgi:group I intron endonuclease